MGKNCSPLQALALTFAEGLDGIRMLSVLNGYAEKGWVRFESKILVLAILGSQDWGRTGRKLTMWFVQGLLWDEDDFLSLAERGIDAIRIASDSPLNAMQSGKQKKREEALANITEGVLTNEFRREFSEWGLTFKHYALELHGLHSVGILVKNGEETAFSVHLDGWSGNIISDTGAIITFCASYETAQAELRKKLYVYLEAAAA